MNYSLPLKYMAAPLGTIRIVHAVYLNDSEWFTAALNDDHFKHISKNMENFYYVYILLSQKDGLFYIGSSNNLDRRIKEHQVGKNISTAKRLPLDLIYSEGHLSKIDARRRELYFKTTKGKVTLRQILRDSLVSFKE